MCFQYDMQYRPGSQNAMADCLSRVPLIDSSMAVDSDGDLCTEIAEISLLNALPLAEFKAECENCSVLTQLRQVIRSGWPKVKKAIPSELQPYYLLWHELAVEAPLIFRGARLLVPKPLQERIVHLAHEGHQGVVRTKQRLRELYWWPHMDDFVCKVLLSCSICQSCDKTAKASPAPLQPVELPGGPFQHVACDIVGPIEHAPYDCRYAITLIDYFSKWPEVAFNSNATTATVITFLTTVFASEGNPLAITTDNGPQFTSSAFADFVKEKGIKHIRTSVNHPQANGCIERFNRVLKDCIQAAEVAQRPLKPAVTELLQSYRATGHATTGKSPFQLLRGRPMWTKLNVIPPQRDNGEYENVRTKVAQQQDKSKQYFDLKRGAKAPKISVGDKVHVRKPFHVGKGERQYTEPLIVQKQTGMSTFILSDGKRWNAARLSRHDEIEEDNRPAETLPSPATRQRESQPPAWTKDYVMT